LTSTTTTITPANIKKKKNENTKFEKSMDNIQLVPTSRNIKAGTRTFGLQLIPTLKPILSAECDNNKPCQNGNVWILCNPRPRSKFFMFCYSVATNITRNIKNVVNVFLNFLTLLLKIF
jgi:hypothetical protein